jgi:hypothetical protein
MMSSWPASTCCSAGAEPRNGTNWNLLPVTVCSESPLTCGGLARPPVPKVTVSGLALSQVTSSPRFFAGRELRDMISIGPFDSIETGSKSFSKS